MLYGHIDFDLLTRVINGLKAERRERGDRIVHKFFNAVQFDDYSVASPRYLVVFFFLCRARRCIR